MLRSTFIHVPGIGAHKEAYLWEKGIRTWDDFLASSADTGFGRRATERMKWQILRSDNEYKRKNHAFFSSQIPISEHWRAYPDFKTCFLDIETTGLSKDHSIITVIGAYDGNESRIFVQGKNFYEFADYIKQFSTIVTFNGKSFDLPFISHHLKICFDQLHIDLRFIMKQVGYTGGLKSIERQLGLARDSDIEGIDGFEAVRLWHRYCRGDEASLEKLIKYNIADIVNLKTLMDFAFEKKTLQLEAMKSCA